MAEHKTLRAELDEELEKLTFSGKMEVRKRTHPKSRKDKLIALWNKELELSPIPLISAAVSCLLIVWSIGAYDTSLQLSKSAPYTQATELVEAGGNIYFKEQYEGRLQQYAKENND
ncbi:hypothetical protein [Paenibacillus sp. GXUN7292]|uniref:hypothetical protein n=1 Tax=Paenibacillus sp. GXUN7292 TaxID=3422499 RepID=UPI003D7DC0E5